jgi:hypothetical protein
MVFAGIQRLFKHKIEAAEQQEPSAELSSELKAWLDEVILPILTQEVLDD